MKMSKQETEEKVEALKPVGQNDFWVTETLRQLHQRTKEALEWSAMLTSETQPLFQAFTEYLWPKSIESLGARLRDIKGRMICISGLQGVGKSRACTMLYQHLKEVEVKLDENQGFHRTLMFKFPKDGDWVEAIWRASPTAYSLFAEEDQHELKTNSKFRRYHVRKILQLARTVLIDLGDYGRKDARLMNRDLDKIQELWTLMLELGLPAPNLLIFIQKELYKGHFFLGKFEHLELKPFTAAELVEAYKKVMEGHTSGLLALTSPFEEAALLELGQMSRGIFRRFKRYIHKCVEAYQPDNATLISPDFVRKIITFDEIAADMQLQLSDLFSKPEHRTIAIRLLEYARLNPDLNQTVLAERLEVDDGTLSRILSKLELQGYIQRQQGEHGQKKVNLMLMSTGEQLHDIIEKLRYSELFNQS
jgi:DNA-binding MarR family transcriptional regulator